MQDFKKYLNSIVSKKDELLKFDDIDLSTPSLQEEYPYFQNLLKLVDKDVQAKLIRMKDLEIQIERQIGRVDTETGDDKASAVGYYNKLLSMMEDLVALINRDLSMFETPYFGKIKFDRKAVGHLPPKELNVYIGKFGYIDPQTQIPLVSDWRAPIANLYYENSGPKDDVQFNSPVGPQKGSLKQKRQFEIAESRIQSIYDAKSGNAAADEFLLKQLNNRLGKKLADIVATIQEQQNTIIREEINKPVIIQGVAGSGKTTILLHRIAYVLYTYKESIKAERSLIIGPNSMFMDYISDVLPSLGVHGIGQNTYIGFAHSILGWSDKFDGRYIYSTEPENLKIKKFKGSIKFKEIIDRYFEDYEEKLLTSIDDRAKDIIAKRYRELKSNETLNMVERLDLSVDFAFAQLKFKANSTAGDFLGLERHDERASAIKTYIRKLTKPYVLYRDMFKHLSNYYTPDMSDNEITLSDLAKHSIAGLKTIGSVTYYRAEDLAPLVDIHLRLFGSREHMKDSIAVDEAQDLSEYQLFILLKLSKGNNLTIAGDIAQSITPPFYISDWVNVMNNFESTAGKSLDFKYHQLFRCYRTTIEVIEFANKIFEKYFPKSYKLPEAVLRHGDPVQVIKQKASIQDANSADLEMISETITDCFEKGSATVALICRDEEHADIVAQALKPLEDNLERTITSFREENYHDGVLVLPITKAKGLEFDSVMILDVSKKFYTESELDTRLFYVAVSRTLHRLFISVDTSQESSPLLGSIESVN